jgi:tRNA-specific 2-thiouridylase
MVSGAGQTSPGVVVGLSGGVDSGVTAALLKERGYRVHGVFLCMTTPDGPIQTGARSCCSPDDARDARRIAEQLGIRFDVRSVSDAMVPIMDRFAATYQAGQTPNPCPFCNATVKFPVLLDEARRIGAAYVATGHYARIGVGEDGRAMLRRAAFLAKDQSYVLYGIGRELLDRLVLPLGEFASKEMVREEAVRLRLEVADKPDSQDICFVPDGGYPELLRRYGVQGLEPGDIVDAAGDTVGRHRGYAHYTVGQHRSGYEYGSGGRARGAPRGSVDGGTGHLVGGCGGSVRGAAAGAVWIACGACSDSTWGWRRAVRGVAAGGCAVCGAGAGCCGISGGSGSGWGHDS